VLLVTASARQRPDSSLVFTRGDFFAAKVDVRINTVNCKGAMGTGLALEFKKRYPEMYLAYRDICIAGDLAPGVLHVWKTDTEWVVNFPTKRHWHEPSRYEDVELGLVALRDYLTELGAVKVALPALGCRNGGLDWTRVSAMIRKALEGLEATIFVFEPDMPKPALQVPAAQPPLVAPLSVPPRPAPKPFLQIYDARAHGADCDHCPLNGLPVVPPSPPTACEVPDAIFIGQEPGIEEERQLRPFIGPSGRKVDKMLAKHGMKRERMYVTNAALCRPRQDEDRLQSMKCCAPRLRNELDAIPKSVPAVPMGVYAFASTWGRKIPITLGRGFVWEKDGREIYPTLHPAFVLRDHIQSPLFSRDFRRVAKRVSQGYLELDTPKSFEVPRTVEDLKRMLAKFGPRVSCDIETTEDPATRCTLLCIGLSDVKTTIVIPWYPFFRHLLNQFFKTHLILGHNFFAFDSIVLERYGITAPMVDICVPKLEDTLIGHHVFASHMPQRLDHLVSVYLDMTPWKIKYGKRASDEKGKPKVPQNEEELFKYNAIDSFVTARVDQEMQADLAPWQSLYVHDKELAALCRDMQMNGVLVNQKLKDELSVAILEKEKRLFEEMKVINNGEDFAPTKTAHIRAILFDKFKAPVLERTMKGLPSTNKKVLQAFAAAKDRPYGEFCKKLVTLRACSKMRVTYLDNLPIESDGRVRAGWRSFGTPTGRFACRKPNLTNLRRPENKEPEQRIREIYIAPTGHTLVGFDMSQVEPRCAAYVSGDPNMMAVFDDPHGDFHTSNARVLFPDEPSLADPKGAGKNFRTMAKSAGLAVNYLAGADKLFETIRAQGFSVRYPQVVAMLDRLHRAYKGHFERVDRDVEFVRKHGFIKLGYLSGRVRWLGHAPSPSDCANCLDEETEALTPHGWVRGFDLKIGTKLLTKNIETGQLSWEPATRVQLFPNYKGPLVEFKSRSFNAVTTPNHRWMVDARKSATTVCRTTEDLARGFGDYSIHRTGMYDAPPSKIYTDDFVELVGWLLTDGSVVPGPGGYIVVYQSTNKPKNAKNVKRINALFVRLDTEPNFTKVARGGCRWRLCGDSSLMQMATKLFPNRTLSFDFLLALTRDQLRLLLNTMMLGDGYDTDRRRFTCRDVLPKDAFQALCTLLGIATTARWRGPAQPKKQYASIGNRPKSKGCWSVTLLRNDTAQVLVHPKRYGKCKERVDQVRQFEAAQPVWCPVVRNSFFVARRRGDVFITGNSPIQGTAADVMNRLLIRIWKRMKKTFGATVKLIGQIHDAAIFEVPDALVQQVRQIIQEEADVPVVINDRPVVFPIDLKDGPRWVDV